MKKAPSEYVLAIIQFFLKFIYLYLLYPRGETEEVVILLRVYCVGKKVNVSYNQKILCLK